jgi:hypothetical protein
MRERALRSLISLLLILAFGAAARGQDVSRLESAIRQLERAAHPRRDASHLPRLLALRQLEDPRLRTFYRDLLRRDDWQLQVHGALGLAEISDPPALDPDLAAQIDGDALVAVIANAIDLDLVTPESLLALAKVDGLAPMPRLLVLGELLLVDREQAIDRAAIESLVGSDELETSGLACVLLAAMGDVQPLHDFDRRLEPESRLAREKLINYLIESIRQYEAAAAAPWVKAKALDPGLDMETRYWALHTLLELDPREGFAALRNTLRDDDSLRTQVRAATLLLASADELPPEAAVLLTADHPLLDAAREAIRSLASDSPSASALAGLLDLDHMRTTQWILGAMDEWPSEMRIALWRHMIDSIEDDGPGRAERIARAMVAASELMELAPDRLIGMLRRTEDGSLRQEVLLMGMLSEPSKDALVAARALERIGAGRADSLALLVIARNADALSTDELSQLGVVAAGGGRVSDGLQTQAAWLYVRHAGAEEIALRRMKAAPTED